MRKRIPNDQSLQLYWKTRFRVPGAALDATSRMLAFARRQEIKQRSWIFPVSFAE